MIYFIPWVVLLLSVITAFFVTMAMNKPRRPKAVAAPIASMDDAAFEEAPVEDEVQNEATFGEVPVQADEAVVDDFAAFDQEFK